MTQCAKIIGKNFLAWHTQILQKFNRVCKKSGDDSWPGCRSCLIPNDLCEGSNSCKQCCEDNSLCPTSRLNEKRSLTDYEKRCKT